MKLEFSEVSVHRACGVVGRYDVLFSSLPDKVTKELKKYRWVAEETVCTRYRKWERISWEKRPKVQRGKTVRRRGYTQTRASECSRGFAHHIH